MNVTPYKRVKVTPKFGVVVVAAISHQFRSDYHTPFLTVCGIDTKSACTRLIMPSFDSIPDAVPSI